MKVVKSTTLAAAFVAAAAVLTAPIASATVYNLDFAAEGAANERGLVKNGVDNVLTFVDGLNSLDVTITATGAGPDNVGYLDGLSNNKPAGLGVCADINAGLQCTPSSDDNITSGEAVKLAFSEEVDLSGLTFRDADHNDITTSSNTLLIDIFDGNGPMSFAFAVASATTFTGLTMIEFGFGGTSADQFYLNGVATVNEVPLPAPVLLLMAGLAGLGVVSRKKRAA